MHNKTKLKSCKLLHYTYPSHSGSLIMLHYCALTESALLQTPAIPKLSVWTPPTFPSSLFFFLMDVLFPACWCIIWVAKWMQKVSLQIVKLWRASAGHRCQHHATPKSKKGGWSERPPPLHANSLLMAASRTAGFLVPLITTPAPQKVRAVYEALPLRDVEVSWPEKVLKDHGYSNSVTQTTASNSVHAGST